MTPQIIEPLPNATSIPTRATAIGEIGLSGHRGSGHSRGIGHLHRLTAPILHHARRYPILGYPQPRLIPAHAMALRVSIPRSSVAGLLRDLRIRAGVRQAELAGRLGVPQSFVSKYETGERRLDVGEVQAICAVLGLSLVEFAGALVLRQAQDEREGQGD
jgi:DNA-binding transcriptional regulator YiaG